MRRARVAAALAAALSLTLAFAACAASPTTTYIDDAGETLTVNWADYPAAAWIDTDDVLAAPTSEEAFARADLLLGEISEALSQEFDAEFGPFEWQVLGDREDFELWHPMHGNGYGGESMLHTFNSQGWQAEVRVPSGQWQRVVEVAATAAARHGLDYQVQQSLDPGVERWLRNETFHSNDVEWVMFSVQDASLDAEALRDAEAGEWLVAGISFGYGITTIREGDRAEFERRAAPFRGLERPKETHS